MTKYLICEIISYFPYLEAFLLLSFIYLPILNLLTVPLDAGKLLSPSRKQNEWNSAASNCRFSVGTELLTSSGTRTEMVLSRCVSCMQINKQHIHFFITLQQWATHTWYKIIIISMQISNVCCNLGGLFAGAKHLPEEWGVCDQMKRRRRNKYAYIFALVVFTNIFSLPRLSESTKSHTQIPVNVHGAAGWDPCRCGFVQSNWRGLNPGPSFVPNSCSFRNRKQFKSLININMEQIVPFKGQFGVVVDAEIAIKCFIVCTYNTRQSSLSSSLPFWRSLKG